MVELKLRTPKPSWMPRRSPYWTRATPGPRRISARAISLAPRRWSGTSTFLGRRTVVFPNSSAPPSPVSSVFFHSNSTCELALIIGLRVLYYTTRWIRWNCVQSNHFWQSDRGMIVPHLASTPRSLSGRICRNAQWRRQKSQLRTERFGRPMHYECIDTKSPSSKSSDSP